MLWEQNFEEGYADFDRLGLQAQFRSWISAYNAVTGDYGLKLFLYSDMGKTIEIDKDKIPLEIRQSAKLYSEYKAKKEKDKDIDPCIKNGCNFSKRQTCCGCRERIEWEKRRKNGNSNKNGTN